MKDFFNSTKEFSSLVKISESTDFGQLAPIIDYAEMKYLYPIIGVDLVNKIRDSSGLVFDTTKKVIANFAMMIAVTTLSVRLSDSGITVAKKEGNNGGEGYVPASDTKIASLVRQYKTRGYSYLDRLMTVLDSSSDDISKKFDNPNSFVPTVDVFTSSDVDIKGSLYTFCKLKGQVNIIQRYELQPILGYELYTALLEKFNNRKLSDVEIYLVEEIQRYLTAKAAFTGIMGLQNEEEDAPLSFAEGASVMTAARYKSVYELAEGIIRYILVENADVLGIESVKYFDNGSPDAKIFAL